MAELQHRMSSREFSEWLAFYGLEPWGEERADLRAGIVASTVANTARDPKKRSRPFEPKEFMPAFGPEDPDKSGDPEPEELWAKLKSWAVGAGGGGEHP